MINWIRKYSISLKLNELDLTKRMSILYCESREGRMKNKILIILLITVFMIFASNRKQDPQWKGTIEEEGGVKVIKNPNEPLYGEMTFDLVEDLSIGSEDDSNYMFYRIRGLAVDAEDNILISDMSNYRIQVFDKDGKYIKTIGRSGQGPGEFEQPTLIRVDSSYGKIYVNDMFSALDIFDREGDFTKSLKLSFGIHDFFPFKDDTILALLLKSSDLDKELTNIHVLCQLDDQGELLHSFAEYPYTSLKRRVSGGVFSTSTGYELAVHMAVLDQKKFVYGYSKEYELNVMNLEGLLLCRIRMDQPRPQFSSEEQREYKRLKFPVPESKPYFFSILSDTEGRIYVQRNKTEEGIRGYGPIDTTEKEVDIFSPDGYYLYRSSLPPNTNIIKNGYLYTRELDEEQGMEYVKRYRIKNWEQIRGGVR